MDYALTLFASHLADLRYSPKTVSRYLQVLRQFREHLAEAARGRLLDCVTKEDVVLFLRQSHADAAATQNVRLSALRVFFAFLRRQGMAERNPAEEVDFLPVRAKEPTFLSMREYQQLLRAVRRRTLPELVTRNEAILVLLFNTGLRVSELASLTLDMCDHATKAFRNVPLKGGGFGSVEWNRETERVLEAWLAIRKTWPVPQAVRELFVTASGNPLSVRAIQELFSRCSRAARLGKKVTAHVLRHSMAT
ncbi:MAG: tyrosine-type recombinase/integrase, partial [Nitrosomonadales bacterium]|nr:tyrosine-type recombinase/integrase [Nitrosomonadales bacterium]